MAEEGLCEADLGGPRSLAGFQLFCEALFHVVAVAQLVEGIFYLVRELLVLVVVLLLGA